MNQNPTGRQTRQHQEISSFNWTRIAVTQTLPAHIKFLPSAGPRLFSSCLPPTVLPSTKPSEIFYRVREVALQGGRVRATAHHPSKPPSSALSSPDQQWGLPLSDESAQQRSFKGVRQSGVLELCQLGGLQGATRYLRSWSAMNRSASPPPSLGIGPGLHSQVAPWNP